MHHIATSTKELKNITTNTCKIALGFSTLDGVKMTDNKDKSARPVMFHIKVTKLSLR